VFLSRRQWPLYQFFIPAPFALPRRVYGRGITRVLIRRLLRRDDLSAATRTRASPGGALLDVDVQQLALVVHFVIRLFLQLDLR